MMEVKRSTQRDKLVTLSRFYKNIVAEIQWGYQLQKNTFKVGTVEK